jgi:hypothetical protein
MPIATLPLATQFPRAKELRRKLPRPNRQPLMPSDIYFGRKKMLRTGIIEHPEDASPEHIAAIEKGLKRLDKGILNKLHASGFRIIAPKKISDTYNSWLVRKFWDGIGNPQYIA